MIQTLSLIVFTLTALEIEAVNSMNNAYKNTCYVLNLLYIKGLDVDNGVTWVQPLKGERVATFVRTCYPSGCPFYTCVERSDVDKMPCSRACVSWRGSKPWPLPVEFYKPPPLRHSLSICWPPRRHGAPLCGKRSNRWARWQWLVDVKRGHTIVSVTTIFIIFGFIFKREYKAMQWRWYSSWTSTIQAF